MTLEELHHLIQTTHWFANLGRAIAAPGIVPVSAAAWLRYAAAATNAEFGLAHEATVLAQPPFANLDWFPTANDEPDPIHGDSLAEAARELGREAEFKAARLSAFRLAIASQRGSPDRPLLKIGLTDFHEAARSAGRLTCRAAAAEIVVERVGFWCDIVRQYHAGHWPLGRLPGEDVVVL